MNILEKRIAEELAQLEAKANLRRLPQLLHHGKWVEVNGQKMLNLSSNDYLGLAADFDLRQEYLEGLSADKLLLSSSSSRLLTGNFIVYEELEEELANRFGKEAALVFNCGYHANTGILPALCTPRTLVLADKLIHASLIDGMHLSAATSMRFRHNDLQHLERLLEKHIDSYELVIIVTESVFSMDGDRADLPQLVALKHRYPDKVMLYVDEAHAFGVFGPTGLGLAEEMDCIADIDLLVGTFGKAAASAGAYLVCSQAIRSWLVNKMRPFIFTTALPPLSVDWTLFILRRLASMQARRNHLSSLGESLRKQLKELAIPCPSVSQIVPWLIGASADAMQTAEMLQRHGFYLLPVRPPTVPEGTSRIRISLTAAMTDEELERLKQVLITNLGSYAI
ncbi:MAG: 8-amino-7-oxononanoate synthase [Bacteroides sp.]